MNRAGYIFVLAIAALFCAQSSQACGAELPFPEVRPDRYGCTIDRISTPGAMPYQQITIWATWGEKTGEPQWKKELPRRAEMPPRGVLGQILPDTSARKKALRDCDKWMSAMDRRLRK